MPDYIEGGSQPQSDSSSMFLPLQQTQPWLAKHWAEDILASVKLITADVQSLDPSR